MTLEEEHEELKRLAAQMYRMVDGTADIYECLEPTGSDDACLPCGCEDCGWHQNQLRDNLLRLGVDV